jgi:hypothetical protein
MDSCKTFFQKEGHQEWILFMAPLVSLQDQLHVPPPVKPVMPMNRPAASEPATLLMSRLMELLIIYPVKVNTYPPLQPIPTLHMCLSPP